MGGGGKSEQTNRDSRYSGRVSALCPLDYKISVVATSHCCVRVCMCLCMNECMYVCMYVVCMYVCSLYVLCMYVCMYVCRYVVCMFVCSLDVCV